MSTTTPNLNFYLPDPGDGSENGKPWGPQVNANFSLIDTYLGPSPKLVSNAVARTQSSVNNDSINVHDFGAVGNGSTDDTVVVDAVHTPALGERIKELDHALSQMK